MTEPPNNAAMTLFDYVVKGGPWTLIVLIVLVTLAGEYGLVDSQTKSIAKSMTIHVEQERIRQSSLDRIVTLLEDQRLISSRAALIACFKEAKYDSDRAECIRKFPVR